MEQNKATQVSWLFVFCGTEKNGTEQVEASNLDPGG
jgi:hypothetical protein